MREIGHLKLWKLREPLMYTGNSLIAVAKKLMESFYECEP